MNDFEDILQYYLGKATENMEEAIENDDLVKAKINLAIKNLLMVDLIPAWREMEEEQTVV